MSTTKKHRRGKLQEKSSSFHGKPSQAMMETRQLRRPSTQPNLLATNGFNSKSTPSENVANRPPQPTKLLLNVKMLGSFGHVHVVMSMDSTVADLIASAVREYVKEGRRPVLPTTDPSQFDLHYSQFCLQCLDREERLVGVSSRNLLLCPKKSKVESSGTIAMGSSCAEQVGNGVKATSSWFKFMDFLL